MEKIIVICLFLFFVCLCLLTYSGISKVNKFSGLIEVLDFKKNKTDILKGVAMIGIFISHIATHTSYALNGMEGIQLWLILIVYTLISLGDIGVGIFFFLSGFGNYKSLKKVDNRNVLGWMWKRIRKILGAFLLCFFISFIINIVLFKAEYSLENIIIDCITLTMPGTTTWYLKVQVLFYVFTLIGAFFTRGKMLGPVVFILCVIYSLFMYQLDFGTFWWYTSLCYPLGIMCADGSFEKIKKIVCKKRFVACIALLSISVSSYLVESYIWPNNYFVRIIGMSLMIVSLVLCVDIIPLKDGKLHQLMKYVGIFSFEVYLIHIGLVNACFNSGVVTINNMFSFIILTVVGSVIAYKIRQLGELYVSNSKKDFKVF